VFGTGHVPYLRQHSAVLLSITGCCSFMCVPGPTPYRVVRVRIVLVYIFIPLLIFFPKYVVCNIRKSLVCLQACLLLYLCTGRDWEGRGAHCFCKPNNGVYHSSSSFMYVLHPRTHQHWFVSLINSLWVISYRFANVLWRAFNIR
jgi:hypothetical protein